MERLLPLLKKRAIGPCLPVISSIHTTRACASALNQLYHYMRLNHRQYGILSSYENTWFVHRNQECAVCEEPQGHETLYVSEGISFTAQTPTVQQCLSYRVPHLRYLSLSISFAMRNGPLGFISHISLQICEIHIKFA
ncbi:hypothetical protein O5D80_004589 [Batrachochytrium dendrobatidis]|nr:hypothetical protein O5D80_004589 [Batrachochytrium dendrobatidis]